MKVTPISEADANAAGLWKRGLVDFEVTDAKEKLSKAGNDMIELLVKVYNAEGKSRTLFDYLVSSEATAYKVRHFAAATGMLPQYEKGELRALDCVGKTGRCQMGIDKGKNGYPDRNNISDYAVKVGGEPLIASMSTEELDDDIPF